jgi:hypothetical protein
MGLIESVFIYANIKNNSRLKIHLSFQISIFLSIPLFLKIFPNSASKSSFLILISSFIFFIYCILLLIMMWRDRKNFEINKLNKKLGNIVILFALLNLLTPICYFGYKSLTKPAAKKIIKSLSLSERAQNTLNGTWINHAKNIKMSLELNSKYRLTFQINFKDLYFSESVKFLDSDIQFGVTSSTQIMKSAPRELHPQERLLQ